MSCCSLIRRTCDLTFLLRFLLLLILLVLETQLCTSEHDTACDFTTLSHFYCNKTKLHSHAAHKANANEREHMQITWQFLTEATVEKKQAFLAHNNYCKTLENP